MKSSESGGTRPRMIASRRLCQLAEPSPRDPIAIVTTLPSAGRDAAQDSSSLGGGNDEGPRACRALPAPTAGSPTQRPGAEAGQRMAGARGSRRQVSWAARDNRGTVRAGIFTLCGPYNGWEAGLGGEKERSDKFARGAQADWAMILLISFRAALAAGASTRPQEPGRERGRKKWSSTSRTTLETTGDTREGAWAAGARRGSRFSRFEGAVSTGALAGPPTVQVNLRWALPGLGSARAPGRPRVAPARPPPTPGGRPCVGSGAGGGPSTSPASSATRGTAGTVPEESARYPRTGAGASQRAREQCRYTRRGDELQKQSHHRPRLSAWQVPQELWRTTNGEGGGGIGGSERVRSQGGLKIFSDVRGGEERHDSKQEREGEARRRSGALQLGPWSRRPGKRIGSTTCMVGGQGWGRRRRRREGETVGGSRASKQASKHQRQFATAQHSAKTSLERKHDGGPDISFSSSSSLVSCKQPVQDREVQYEYSRYSMIGNGEGGDWSASVRRNTPGTHGVQKHQALSEHGSARRRPGWPVVEPKKRRSPEGCANFQHARSLSLIINQAWHGMARRRTPTHPPTPQNQEAAGPSRDAGGQQRTYAFSLVPGPLFVRGRLVLLLSSPPRRLLPFSNTHEYCILGTAGVRARRAHPM
ncbi:hypothetical protein PCL_06563 [Purpureocillium lilacinum]|uniref:Uncharacterized protein n=1 Tax=Purpureocillium lilacinum TaxID=33203 RepID=A0A2U3EN24_PURLI|nr:hypothetical protein PCL_06563 [Purpureocillium lilacinum]